MGYADLISRLQALPEAQQAEVLDFVEFLEHRNQAVPTQSTTLAQSPLARWINDPVVVPNFKPLSRDEANAR